MFKVIKAQVQPGFVKSILILSSLGLMLPGVVMLSGCGGPEASQQEVKKDPPVVMSVLQVDQLSRLDDKVPEGQYLVARVSMKNTTNATIVLDPNDFSLQNITENEKDRYSQPEEKGLTNQFTKVYGSDFKDKLVDFDVTNLYPRMQVERFFVFMVPSDSALNGYQIAYKPASLSTPLVTPEVTVINDHRTEAASTNDSQSNKP